MFAVNSKNIIIVTIIIIITIIASVLIMRNNKNKGLESKNYLVPVSERLEDFAAFRINILIIVLLKIVLIKMREYRSTEKKKCLGALPEVESNILYR